MMSSTLEHGSKESSSNSRSTKALFDEKVTNRSSMALLGEAFCRKGDDSDQFIFYPSTENDFSRKLSLYIFERTRHFLVVVPRKAFWTRNQGFQKHGSIGTGILLQQAANNRVPGLRS